MTSLLPDGVTLLTPNENPKLGVLFVQGDAVYMENVKRPGMGQKINVELSELGSLSAKDLVALSRNFTIYEAPGRPVVTSPILGRNARPTVSRPAIAFNEAQRAEVMGLHRAITNEWFQMNGTKGLAANLTIGQMLTDGPSAPIGLD